MKSKEISKKKEKNDWIGLDESKGEEHIPIKWWDYEIETFVAICGEMEQEYAKPTRKYSKWKWKKKKKNDRFILDQLGLGHCFGPPFPLIVYSMYDIRLKKQTLDLAACGTNLYDCSDHRTLSSKLIEFWIYNI